MAQKPSSSGGSGAPGGNNPGSGGDKQPDDKQKAGLDKGKSLRVGEPKVGGLKVLTDYEEQYEDHMARRDELLKKYARDPTPLRL